MFWNIIVILMYTLVCLSNILLFPVFFLIFIFKKNFFFCLTPFHLKSPVCFPYLELSFCSVCLFILFLGSTSKWNHIVFVFLCMTSLSMVPSRSINADTNGKISFLFIAKYYFYVCTSFSLYTHLLMGT